MLHKKNPTDFPYVTDVLHICYFSMQKCTLFTFLISISLDQRVGTKSKKPVFCKILQQISFFFCIFQRFSTKNAENYYFDQRLACAAPKHLSKYTTCRAAIPKTLPTLGSWLQQKLRKNITVHLFAIATFACYLEL